MNYTIDLLRGGVHWMTVYAELGDAVKFAHEWVWDGIRGHDSLLRKVNIYEEYTNIVVVVTTDDLLKEVPSAI